MSAMKIHKVEFVNEDAADRTTTIHVSTDSIEAIMAWYGAYYAGDNYKVLVDGKEVEKNRNGELIGEID